MAVSSTEVGKRWTSSAASSVHIAPTCWTGRTACVVLYVLSLVTQGMGFRRVHTQLAKKAVVMCRWTDVDEQMDGLW